MKKIIITESQLKTIILKENNSEELDERVIYEDDNINLSIWAPQNKVIKMGYGDIRYIKIKVYNKSKKPLVLTVEGANNWGYRGEYDLNFTKEPIFPTKYGNIKFSIDGSARSDGGFFNTTLNVMYITGNVNKNVSLRVGFTKPSRDETINYCKKFYNDSELEKVKSTLTSWLKDPITMQKYMKNWKKTKEEVNDIFEDYLDIVQKVKFKYTIDPTKDFMGRVEPRNFNNWFKTAAFVPVTINCVQKYIESSIKEKNIEPLLIHEIQHLFNLVHPWHPEGESPNKKTSPSDFSSAIISTLDKNVSAEKEVTNRLIQDGFDPIKAKFFVSDYFRLLSKGKASYLEQSNELASFVLGFRRFLNLKPGEQITQEQLIKNGDQNQAFWILNFYIHSKLPFNQFLSQINSYAKVNNNNKTTYNV